MSAVLELLTGQLLTETQITDAGQGHTSLVARLPTQPMEAAPQGNPVPPPATSSVSPKGEPLVGLNPTALLDHLRVATQTHCVRQGQDNLGGHPIHVAHNPLATEAKRPDGQVYSETHVPVAVGSPTSPPGQGQAESQRERAGRGPILADPFLGILAATVDDLEENRKGLANRYRQLTRAVTDVDGRQRGLGLDESAPEVKLVRDLLVAIGGEKLDGSGGIEHQAILKLNGRMRKHPLWKTWGLHQRGVGEKQLARLLASIGDPYWNDLHDRPRTVSELWSYCGYSVVHPASHIQYAAQDGHAGGVAPKKARGAKVNWSGDARMRTWNIFGSCLKAQGDYAQVYYAAREKYADATHSIDCTRCGPKGKPALPGSALSDGHKHARAIRITCKEILRDLWVASKALHEAEQNNG